MKPNKKYILYITLFFVLGFGINSFLDKRYEKLITQNTTQAFAIYDGYILNRNVGPKSYFYFIVENKKKITSELGKFDFLQKGDTVLIKYSLTDPSINKIIDYCYMKKHRGKDYCK